MNALRRIWTAGGIVVNGWVNLPCAFSAELIARAGFDSLTIDLQHGLHDYASMLACLQAIGDMPALVRVPWNEPAMVGRALDAGAAGSGSRWTMPITTLRRPNRACSGCGF